ALMDKVTQQNAASSEESSAAAAELNSQSSDLHNLVSTFELTRPATEEPLRRPPSASPERPVPQKKSNGSSARSSIALTPEEVIPLDGDIAFKDF
ncbi:MAG TPA: chemotaxis protein, partial [Anaeromyxobacteraceae bacterium]|nr:chemotaxis protein [Anaeromyxobacteraceae bacterium]